MNDSKGNHDHLHNETIGPSEDKTTALGFGHHQRRLTATTKVGEAQVADALTRLHGDGDLLRAVCCQDFTVLVEAPEIMAAGRQEQKKSERAPRVKSPLKIAVACDRNVNTCDTDANRDLIRNPILTLPPCHVMQPSGSRTSLRNQCFFYLVQIFVEFCYSLGFGTTAVSGDS